MALYSNNTRFDAIVTIKVAAVVDPKDALKIGIQSAMKSVALQEGIHDLLVGPGEELDLSQGVVAEYLAARSAPR